MSSTLPDESKDRLLLSLSHAPLPTALLNELISLTASKCNSMLESIAETRKQMESDENDEKKEAHSEEKQSKKGTILHILATGTPYVVKPGKSQPDYIHQWTKGEKILADLVDKIGMDKFHRIPKDGETKLSGRLIDVKPSDFEFILNHSKDQESSNNNNKSSGECWSDDCLNQELTWIANNILRILIIDERPDIGIAKIAFPFDPRFEDIQEDKILRFVEAVFQREWSDAKGPLNGAKIEIIIVKAGLAEEM